jgi:L-threonylcarbamoyladenylate synthase
VSAPIIPFDPTGVERAAACIEAGGLLIFPTETVYGIGADFNDIAAIHRVFAAKGRQTEQALPLLVSTQDQLDQVISFLPSNARILIDRFWPGPLTLVLPAHSEVPRVLTGGLPTVAVRQTASPIACALIDRLGKPVIGTSANRSGQPPATSAKEAASTFSNDIDLILDGGQTTVSPSTLVDVSGTEVSILRYGPIAEIDIRNALSA